MTSVRRSVVVSLASLLVLAAAAAPARAEIRAGAGTADATWHVGASAGQYASGRQDDAEFDPFVQQVKNAPSYGVQSRLQARALVVQNGSAKFAVVKIDLYIPQDLLWRRAAQILASENIGIDESNLVMSVTHDHSSPYYTSTAWGAWTFQDVFDIRAYDYYAKQLALAVTRANSALTPVRVGAASAQFAKGNRNALGPAVADDGTPAGFPDSYTDRTLTVVRFDSTKTGKPVANLVTFARHGEDLSGNDLISADFVGPLERYLDRETGATTVFTQQSVGNSEPERNSYHSIHDRLWFTHMEYGQSEYDARLMANTAGDLFRAIGTAKPGDERDGELIPFFSDGKVAFENEWFPGPLTHPFPTVSNCRTDTTTGGSPQLPIVGLPDCAGPNSAFDQVGMSPPVDPPYFPGIDPAVLKAAGVPVPDNYGAVSYTGLEEDVSVHLQAFRIGGILFTVCSCEQWADQSQNISTRTDRVPGNEWMGFDWATYRGLDDTGRECFQLPPYDGSRWSCPHPDTAQTRPCARNADGTWDCPDPTRECLIKGAAFQNTCRDPGHEDARLAPIPDAKFRRMEAQVRNCANGWNSLAYASAAESEPVDIALIKGSYTCDDSQRSADLGYQMTIPISMANDYNGYIATYREYQRGDHYRKALTGWGPHSSDYLATRLVKLGRLMNGGPALDKTVDGGDDPDADNPALVAKTAPDQANNDARAQALGRLGDTVAAAYEAKLPDDAGDAAIVAQPHDVQRFNAAFLQWNGGGQLHRQPDRRRRAPGREPVGAVRRPVRGGAGDAQVPVVRRRRLLLHRQPDLDLDGGLRGVRLPLRPRRAAGHAGRDVPVHRQGAAPARRRRQGLRAHLARVPRRPVGGRDGR